MLPSSAIVESFRSENENEDKCEFRSRKPGLVLGFRPRLRVHVICYFKLKTTRFAFFTLFLFCLFFSHIFKEKICVTTEIMLCMYDTLHEDDVLMIFDELEVQNSHL